MRKRAFDLFFALLGLVVLSPLLLVIAVAVRCDDRGPVFYRQIRVGLSGRPFRIWKFRSMRHQPQLNGPLITVGGDRRITRVGKFLRRSKLDELPQLLNVLAGEMSLVGPRPEVPQYAALYSEEQRHVLAVRPGITDPASLRYRDEESLLAADPDPDRYYREVCIPAKLAINLHYARNASLWTDFRVIIATLSAVLSSRPASRSAFRPSVALGSLILGVIVLLVVVAIAVFHFQTAVTRPALSLARGLPEKWEDWTITDLRLADTELAASQASRKLDFDDYVYRRFEKNGRAFDVYVAYWRARKLPASMVAAHTPDVCWVSGGWRKEKSESRINLSLRGGETGPGEGRIFVAPDGETRYVWFWHVGGDETAGDYARSLSGWAYVRARFGHTWRDLRSSSSDQYFVRVSSIVPYEIWRGDALFESVMDSLGQIALYRKNAPLH